MKLAMLACLAALCLIGPSAHAAPGDAPKPAAPAHPAAPAEAGSPQPAGTPGEATAPTQAAPRAAASGRAERRRRSYAACNRASHQRGLRGGKRRRFLIRCRLGYERTRSQAGQPAAVGQPTQPGRKP
ncbi:hypothetical protein MMSR116_22075 [Methylobacterium mesophilicum SR1.6/6]|uniref:Serine/threonine protein kinase n=1 Tax=Methylobacterium mesophilicum SR1.6/6 TaxID=908290 RepID=A0A6B9FQY4_9HYPH|nr:hypothetical protein [Methylobacterium mesophilicum]QGY04289.1 hypothetical protein MMSR116_22075 [Methylobacterium mesophilicum SR1.6/6]